MRSTLFFRNQILVATLNDQMEHTAMKNKTYAEFIAYDTLENKLSKSSEYYSDKVNDNLIENNHEEYSYLQN